MNCNRLVELSLGNFFFCFFVIKQKMQRSLALNLHTSTHGDGIFDNLQFPLKIFWRFVRAFTQMLTRLLLVGTAALKPHQDGS